MQAELLRLIVESLTTAQIPHMVTGSYASTYHGEPRMTRDIDLVIDPTVEQMTLFAENLDQNRFYMPDWGGSFERRQMVNVIDLIGGWKVDLVFRKERPFSTSEFARRQSATINGVDVYVATVEDTILAKLEWASRSGSDRQLDDVRGMMRVADVDTTYVDRWADELGIAELWNNVRTTGPKVG